MILKGYLSNYENGALTIIAPLEDDYQIVKQNITECEIRLDDGRSISADQRRKIFAIIHDITDYVTGLHGGKVKKYGYQMAKTEIETLRQMQLLYLIDYSDTEAVRYQLTQHYCQLCGIDLFSLSDVDMTTARDFIDWLIELCIVHGIPCNDTLLNRCEDVGRYLYACLANRRCAICGKKADLHHVDHVGAGRNRREIVHRGMHVLPLCRIHHNECHNIGQQTFNEKYHIFGIKLDDYLCEVLKLKGE